MSRESFLLRTLDISRMPGFSRGTEKLTMADNINIITGPNASGKSSTARVMEKLIWPSEIKGLEAKAAVKIGGDHWDISIDPHLTLTQKNGQNQPLHGIPAAEGKRRYHLPLHELVQDNEEDLAKELMKQAKGGYDLKAAANSLGYSAGANTTRQSEYKDLQQTEEKHREIEQLQKDLKNQEKKLVELLKKKLEAKAASSRKDFYHISADYLEEKTALEDLYIEARQFPCALAELSGNELISADELQEAIEQAEKDKNTAEVKLREAQDMINALSIARDEPLEQDETILRTRIDNLKEISRNIKELSSKTEICKEALIAAAKTLDSSINLEQWQGLDLRTTADLEQVFGNAQRTLNKKENIENQVSALLKELENIPVSEEDGRKQEEGIRLLSYWLKEQTGGPGIPKWSLMILLILAVATALLSFFSVWGLLGLIPIIILSIYTYFIPADKNKTTAREQDFSTTGLESPAAWNIENVTSRLEELVEELRDLKQREKLKEKIQGYNEELEQLRPRLTAVESEYKTWKERLGALPALASDSPEKLYWFLIHAKKWQEAHTALRQLKTEKSSKKHEFDEELQQVNEVLNKHQLGPVKDETEATAALGKFQLDVDILEKQLEIISREEDSVLDLQQKLKEQHTKHKKLYCNLQLELNDRQGMQNLLDQLPRYKNIKSKIAAADINLKKTYSRLQNHSLYAAVEQKPEELSLDQVQEMKNEEAQKARDLEEISEEIIRIQTLVENKKLGHELEDVLTEKEKARQDLEELYEQNLASRTGQLLLDRLKQKTGEQNDSPVFARANELLAGITANRYRLFLDNEQETFKAYDNKESIGLNLNEISTGTRVQLLLAVRLAFVESQESTVKLPVFADELLANSDELRAKAIIEALIQVSREGRQVFYFTAQDDEVGKWKEVLDQKGDIDYKIISLTSGSETEADFISDLREPLKFSRQVPEPAGMTHTEYGRKIEKETYNPLTSEPAELHLWYLIEDLDLLYKCLSQRIEYWGQLENFRSHTATEDLDEDGWKQLKNKVKLLQRLQNLYRRGRSLPVNREVLEASNAVSETFRNAVAQKAKKVDNDPVALLEALRNKEVPRFQSANIDMLEEYFEENGYLNREEPLEEEVLSLELSRLINQLQIDELEAADFCNRILGTEDYS